MLLIVHIYIYLIIIYRPIMRVRVNHRGWVHFWVFMYMRRLFL